MVKKRMLQPMKIVYLDSFAANHGQFDYSIFENIEGCQFVKYDKTSPSEVIERSADADIILVNKVIIDKGVMEQLPNLKYVGVMATGYNVVDTVAAHELGIVVSNIPAYSTMSVAQHTFALLLNITQQVALHDNWVKQGNWQKNPHFCHFASPLIELAGKTMAIVGLGNTGMATARIALAMGMNVLAYTSKSATELPDGIEATRDYDELFKRADVLSLHCPLNDKTFQLVNKKRLALMKKNSIVINTGRGPLIDENALAEALKEKRIFAAGVDVLCQEPPVDGSPLIGLENCYITPHIAWGTLEARERLFEIAVDNIKAFLAGSPKNQV